MFALLALLFVAESVAAKSSLSPQKDGEYDIYLLVGQSNMAGRGAMIEGDELYEMKNVWLLDEAGVPQPAHNPLNKYSSVRKSEKAQGISPGTAFGVEVAEKTGRRVLLVVNALGASSLEQWSKDAPLIQDKGSLGYQKLQLYSEAVRRAKEARKYGQIRGIVWHQGEANSGRVEQYPEMLKEFVADLRKDLDAPDVPFVAGEIAYWRPNYAAFNKMIRGISDFIPVSTWISAEGAGQLSDDKDPHFSRDGQLLLGRRYADAMLKMVYGIE